MGVYHFHRLIGDVNMDGAIDVLDVVKVACIALSVCESTLNEFYLADINADGAINIMDVILVVNMALGIESNFADGGRIRISRLHRPADPGAPYSHEMDVQMCNENDVRGVQMTVRVRL